MSSLRPPATVSPLIKGLTTGARWSFLLAGIAYGSVRYSSLSRKEKRRLEELERTRPEREARQKAEKLKIEKEQIEELNKALTIS